MDSFHRSFQLLTISFLFAFSEVSSEETSAPRDLRRSLEEYDADELVPVLIGYNQEKEDVSAAAGARSGAAGVRLAHNRIEATSITKGQWSVVEEDPSVAFLEYDELNFADADVTSYALPTVQAVQNSLPDAGSNRLPASCADPNVVRVAVIDSGLDGNHPDIACGNVNDLSSTHCVGTSIGTNRPWNQPDDTHGTHVTGIIAAWNNQLGIQGVVPDGQVCIMPVRVFESLSAGVRTSVLLLAVEWAIQNRAAVINFSISGPSGSAAWPPLLAEARRQGSVLVAATGNTREEIERFPASYPDAVAVTALDVTSTRRASFATHGSYVDYAVAGVQILSTTPTTGAAASEGISILSVRVDGASPSASASLMTFSQEIRSEVSGTLMNCGLGTETCPSNNNSPVICLIERGGLVNGRSVTFAEKARNCQNARGTIAAIVYNNFPGPLSGTLGSNSGINIPVIAVSQESGRQLNQAASRRLTTRIASSPGTYGYLDGTSFSAPIVAGTILGLRRSCPQCPLGDVEDCMARTARRVSDSNTGNGIVQMDAAYQCLLNSKTCCGTGAILQQDRAPVDDPPPGECIPDLANCQNHDQCCSLVCVVRPGDSVGKCAPTRTKNNLKEEAFARANRGNRYLKGSSKRNTAK